MEKRGQEPHTFATVFPPQPLLKELATSAMTAARSMPERTGMCTTICSLLQRTEGGRALHSLEGLEPVQAAPKGCGTTGIPKQEGSCLPVKQELYSEKTLSPGSKLAEGHGSLLSMQVLIKDVPFVDDSALGLLHTNVLQGTCIPKCFSGALRIYCFWGSKCAKICGRCSSGDVKILAVTSSIAYPAGLTQGLAHGQ